MALLILGGTTEASRLASLVARARIPAVISLAGRTAEPQPQPLATRIGGFGGADGLARWLADNGTRALVDATHPFAARMCRNAVAACAALGLPLCRLTRPEWKPVPGDRWTGAADAAEAAAALPAEPSRVFLTVGRLDLSAFEAAPRHCYLVRTIDAPDPGPDLPQMEFLRARGPFEAAEEEALMRRHRIEWLVTKNSGGKATSGKLAAARRLGLPVVMIARPEKPAVKTFHAVEEVMGWIASHLSG